MPAVPPPAGPADAAKPETTAAPEGDIRRGGWILVLLGVVLVLLAVLILILF